MPIESLLEDNEAGEMVFELGFQPEGTLARIRLGERYC